MSTDRNSNSILRWTILSLSLLALVVAGCSKYQIGTDALFRSDVHSVHIPMFKSDSLRRNLAERLTEAVVKEIGQQTPYAITSLDNAETVLDGTITFDTKYVLGENRFDEPRALQIGLHVDVTWNNRLGQPLMQRVVLKLDQNTNFIPEGGQSMVTAQQEVIDDLARQIVYQMEAIW